MEKFRHGRVLFAGDAAHGVSPFGARGANSGVQDAENVAWKLKLVLEDKAPDRLLDTYGSEREYAADENILNSTRATDFGGLEQPGAQRCSNCLRQASGSVVTLHSSGARGPGVVEHAARSPATTTCRASNSHARCATRRVAIPQA